MFAQTIPREQAVDPKVLNMCLVTLFAMALLPRSGRHQEEPTLLAGKIICYPGIQ